MKKKLTESQQLTMSLLQVLINFCEKNNIRYYLSGGSLIGLIRHNGFIPWDDDLDIVMPREDYDTFIRLIKTTNLTGYGICDRYTDKNWHFAFSQFIDKESEIEINLAEETRKANIWIDIFPMDGVPNNRIIKWIHIKKILYLRYTIQLANIKTQVDSHRKRPYHEKLLLKIFKIIPIYKLFNTNKRLDKLEKTIKKYPYEKSDYIGNLLGRYRKKEIMLKSYFGNPIVSKFEGVKINIPEKSDAVLKQLYGDYMKLPPIEERVAHNVKIIKSRNLK